MRNTSRGVKRMKRINIFAFGISVLLSVSVLSGCAAKTEKWAYAHEPDEEIIALSDNGKADYKGSKYTYTKDGSYITLKDANGVEERLRFEMSGDSMTLYEKSTYTRQGEGDENSIVGVWLQDNGWSYQFTEDGSFSEENIFFGHYSVDTVSNCIKLMYDDPIEDAYLYYTLNGDELTVAYPWPMVRME